MNTLTKSPNLDSPIVLDATGYENGTTSSRQPAKSIKCEVIRTLHALIDESLFGSRPWLGDREITSALTKKLNTLGLSEPVPGQPNTSRSTALGREVNIDLMQVFMGTWYEYEVPMILKDYGLISEDET